MPEKSKYEAQIQNLRKNYVRFPLDLKPDVLEAFRAACSENGTTPTTEIKKFIARYVAHHASAEYTANVEVELPAALAALAAKNNLDLTDVLVDALTKLQEPGE